MNAMPGPADGPFVSDRLAEMPWEARTRLGHPWAVRDPRAAFSAGAMTPLPTKYLVGCDGGQAFYGMTGGFKQGPCALHIRVAGRHS
jgi:hypothetical protein